MTGVHRAHPGHLPQGRQPGCSRGTAPPLTAQAAPCLPAPCWQPAEPSVHTPLAADPAATALPAEAQRLLRSDLAKAPLKLLVCFVLSLIVYSMVLICGTMFWCIMVAQHGVGDLIEAV